VAIVKSHKVLEPQFSGTVPTEQAALPGARNPDSAPQQAAVTQSAASIPQFAKGACVKSRTVALIAEKGTRGGTIRAKRIDDTVPA
jgi:hypothetical protein